MAKASYYSSGDTFDFIAKQAQTPGDIVVYEDSLGGTHFIGVCESAAAVGEKMTVRINGAVFVTLANPSGFVVGAEAYYDKAKDTIVRDKSASGVKSMGKVLDIRESGLIVLLNA
jgi:hypothetical protein